MEAANDLKNRIELLEERVGDLEDALPEEKQKIIDDIITLIFGNERMKIMPMVDMVNEIYTNWDRAKWLLGVIGITSLGSLIGFLLLVRELFGV